jgi:hypothetical protein
MLFHEILPFADTANVAGTTGKSSFTEGFFNGERIFRVELFAMRSDPAFDPIRRVTGKEKPPQIRAHHRVAG